jgi:hypothetical protein
MFYTTDGQAGFTTIDPASSDRLLLTVYANTFGGGADDLGYFAVQVGDGDPGTGDEAWYISGSPMATPTQNQGNLFDLRHLEYNPAAGNWNSLTLGTPTIGGPAGDLSGLLITGVGIVQSLTNPDGDFSSWNYADYRILAVPEPAASGFVIVAAAACFGHRWPTRSAVPGIARQPDRNMPAVTPARRIQVLRVAPQERSSRLAALAS